MLPLTIWTNWMKHGSIFLECSVNLLRIEFWSELSASYTIPAGKQVDFLLAAGSNLPPVGPQLWSYFNCQQKSEQPPKPYGFEALTLENDTLFSHLNPLSQRQISLRLPHFAMLVI